MYKMPKETFAMLVAMHSPIQCRGEGEWLDWPPGMEYQDFLPTTLHFRLSSAPEQEFQIDTCPSAANTPAESSNSLSTT